MFSATPRRNNRASYPIRSNNVTRVSPVSPQQEGGRPADKERRRRVDDLVQMEAQREKEEEGFIDRTTIHGIKDIYLATSHTMRFLWLFMFLGSLGGMSYELYHLCNHYNAEPTASKITIVYPEEFPAIILCPAQWVDVPKAVNMGVDAEMFHILRMLFYWSDDYYYEMRVYDYDETKQRLQKLINETGGIDQLMTEIGFYADQMIADYTYRRMNSVGSFLTATIGMCFKFATDKVLTQASSVELLEFFGFYNHQDYPEYEKPFEYQHQLSLGDMGFNLRPSGEIYLKPNTNYMMKIRYRHYIHVNLRRAPCMDWTMNDQMRCVYECYIAVCREMWYCEPYIPGENQTDIDRLCSKGGFLFNPSDTTGDHCLDHILYDNNTYSDKCTLECPTPCELKIYQPTVVPYGPTLYNDSAAEISISFADPSNSEMILETKIYNYNTMFSNIGGTVSLWCGASILSAVQIAYMSILQCFRKKE